MKRETWQGLALLAGAAGTACLVVGGGVALASRIALPPGNYASPLAETLFTAVIFVPLLLVAAAAAWLDGRSVIVLGRDRARNAVIGLAIGFAGMLATVGDAHLAGTLVRGPEAAQGATALAWGAAVILFQAGSEEVFFRGWLQPSLAARWGMSPGLLGASAAFALVHVAGGERAPLSLLNLFLGGVVFGCLAQRSGGLVAAVGAHFGWNGAEQLVWGLDPNPGTGSFGALIDHNLVGSAIWGGSVEGLNGSIAMTGVLAAILAPFALTRRRDRTVTATSAT